jgi:hypothetical protein
MYPASAGKAIRHETGKPRKARRPGLVQVRKEDVLAALNGESSLEKGMREFFREDSAFQAVEADSILNEEEFNAEQFRNAQTKMREQLNPSRCAAEHTERLRAYVNLWLATGRDRNGFETPSSRTPTAEIETLMMNIFLTHQVQPVVLKDGFTVTVPSFDAADLVILPMFRSGGNKEPDAADIGEDAAERMFAAMLLSDWRLKIARCKRADCGRYFLLGKWNCNYKNGTFCDACKRARSVESAGRNTAKAREDAEKKLYSLVAERFAGQITGNENWHTDRKTKASIVEHLNRAIERDEELRNVYRTKGRSGVTGKWLGWSKNQKAIEAEVKRRNHATRKTDRSPHEGADNGNCEGTPEGQRNADRTRAAHRRPAQ